MLCDYGAGCISGVAAFLFSYPLDTIKTQQQFRSLSFTEAAKHIHRNRGWKGFYRGSFIPFVANSVLHAIFFGLVGDVRDYLMESRIHQAGWYWALSSKIYNTPYHPHHRPFLLVEDRKTDVAKEEEMVDPTFLEVFISGSVAGFVLLGLTSPIELVKTKLQSQMKKNSRFNSPTECFKTIYKEAGVKGLYRGILPMTIRNIAVSGTRFGLSCSLLNLCEPDLFPINSLQLLVAYGWGGFVTWTVALPFDAIRTKMQTDDHRKPYYRGMAHVAKEIYTKEGLKEFYRGFWNVVVRVAPLNVVTYLVYNSVQHSWCRNLRQQKVIDK